ncbi:lysine exporter LysO family protein [Clostridium sp. UBA7791]|uniref:lysine exporter LysO family protein n=1 Tax=Clostridium sp. UBA7791 TaxID=1946379 RepID=UPI0032170187
MTYIIIVSILVGMGCGYFVFPPEIMSSIDNLASISLFVLIFLVGIDVGGNKTIFKDLKKAGFKVLLVPFGGIVGSLLGGLLVGFLFNMALNESLAIGSGFGWYSLSGVMLKEMGGDTLGAIAFLTNVFREMITVILIPILAKKLNGYTAIAPAGATSMDTTLPLIAKATNPEIAVIAFINGVILSSLVPVFVTFFYNLR